MTHNRPQNSQLQGGFGFVPRMQKTPAPTESPFPPFVLALTRPRLGLSREKGRIFLFVIIGGRKGGKAGMGLHC